MFDYRIRRNPNDRINIFDPKANVGLDANGVLLDAQEAVQQRVAANNLRFTGARHNMKRSPAEVRILLALMLLLTALIGGRANAYTLLTHEELIDLNWQKSIVPLLLSRYPNLTPAQLEEARAYAYGGCVIQDMGYYPFGDRAFSDLTHYVRSGDFVVSLFRNAHNADELAFAVGALAHYVGDSIGHSEATNLSVPVEFPRLRAKFGREVSYAEGKHQHVQTEFAFDIDEIAHHRMAPVRFLRHIGLKVPVKAIISTPYWHAAELLGQGRGMLVPLENPARLRQPRSGSWPTMMHARRCVNVPTFMLGL